MSTEITSTTKREVQAAIKALMAVSDAIKEAGRMPSGHLYTALSTQGCSKQAYDQIIGLLTREDEGVTPLVRIEGDQLVWNG